MIGLIGIAIGEDIQGAPAFTVGTSTVLTNKPAGPAFTRRRYDEFLELERLAEEAEHKAWGLSQEQDRIAAVAAAREAQRVAQEAFDRAQAHWNDDFNLLRLRHAIEAFNGTSGHAAAMRAARLMETSALAAKAQFDDDDEAIAMLLLH